MKRLLTALAALFLVAGPAAAVKPALGGGSEIPAAALSAGYTVNTFRTKAFSAANVDLQNTKASGFQWYLSNFNCQATASEVTFLADGSVSMMGAPCANQHLQSGVMTTSGNYVGQAFGGGAYIEAELAFDLTSVDGGSPGSTDGWPSFWGEPAEHLFKLFNQGNYTWPGQSQGYVHFVEVDIFEALRTPSQVPWAYAASLHDWYGNFGVTCSAFCVVDSAYNSNTIASVPGTDFNLYHRFGVLWVPATSATQGRLDYYFDDIKIASHPYSQYPSGQAPPVTATSNWLYSWVDRQHLVLMMGGAVNTPLKVRSVNVWQASAASNLVQ